MTKIGVLMPVWGRPEVFRIVMDNFRKLDASFKDVSFTVFVIYSDEDKHKKALIDIAVDSGINYHIHQYKNQPIGKKMNAGIREMLNFDWDYLMNIGSDDLVHPKLIEVYRYFFKKKVPLFGINDLIVFNLSDKEAIKYKYDTTDFVIGGARMISREVVEATIAKYKHLYEPNINRGLDTSSGLFIRKTGYIPMVVITNDFPYFVDIKTQTNINGFSVFKDPKYKERIKDFNIRLLYKEFPELKTL